MKNLNSKISKFKKAFTLPEVLVAMGILVVVIFAATALLVSSLRSNKDNVNTMIAYGLAQEALEAVRNIRDSDWLLNAKFNGEVGSKNTPIWGAVFPADLDIDHFYLVEYNPAQQDLIFDAPNNDPTNLLSYTPWKIEEVNTASNCINIGYGVCPETVLKKAADADGVIKYSHNAAGAVDLIETPFHRYLVIKALGYKSNDDSSNQDGVEIIPESKNLVKKLQVSSVVEWKEFNRDRKVQLDTVLTDWKPAT